MWDSWAYHTKDILEFIKDYNGPKFQAVLSDPPYALISIAKRFGPGQAAASEGADGRYRRLSTGFMGETWDGFDTLADYQNWVFEWASLMIERILHPGAVCLFFGGTRTFHRLAVGLEDAGFEISDAVMMPFWVHAQGFPKSHNLTKYIEDESWEGYGTALKPAWEPVFLCRAPRGDYTFGELAQTFGTGTLNIDGARIQGPVDLYDASGDPDSGMWSLGSRSRVGVRNGRWPANFIMAHHPDCVEVGTYEIEGRSINRWADGMKPFGGGAGGDYESEQMPDEQITRWACVNECPVRSLDRKDVQASRFYFSPKASVSEKMRGTYHLYWRVAPEGFEPISREEWEGLGEEEERHFQKTGERIKLRDHGNVHPTVKPLELLRYLATMILPPELKDQKRRIFVPFAGSGSEMIGAMQAGWEEVVGVDAEHNYRLIAEARIPAIIGML